MYPFITHNGLLVNELFLETLRKNNLADFRSLMDFQGGSPVKKTRYRSLVKIRLGDRYFYLKRHLRPSRGRIRSLMPWSAREDARNEWNNMNLLNALGFHTMVPVAFGEEKRSGMTCSSLTLTEGIVDSEKLETYLPAHFLPPLSVDRMQEKRDLIRRLALLAGEFHGKGLNHQDFYLGHLLLRPGDGVISIIDLQRVHRRKRVSRHDRVKDLGQLCYSAGKTGVLTRTDLMRFIKSYLGRDRITGEDRKLIRRILSKTAKIARHDAKLIQRRMAGA
ncbi:MAG: lipopolysaccharide kinase InaA family protein [Candidatus Deferrimicrobiaceae bacterium]